jgi:hypothetical protein
LHSDVFSVHTFHTVRKNGKFTEFSGFFNHISLFGSGISRGRKTFQTTSHVSCTIPGIVFRETLKSNSKSTKFIPEAKYLKKSRKVESFVSAKELMKKWKAIRDNFVRCHRQMTQTETGKAANNKKLYMFYHQLQFLLPHVKGNTSTSSKIIAPAGTQNDVEGSQDILDQTANSTAQDSQIVIEATVSPTTGTNVALSKRKRKNLHTHGSKRTANEQSIAS